MISRLLNILKSSNKIEEIPSDEIVASITYDMKSIFSELRVVAETNPFNLYSEILKYECELKDYISSFQLDNAGVDYSQIYINDAFSRFAKTLSILPSGQPCKVLEIGANPYLFSILLDKLFDFEVNYSNYFDKDPYCSTVSEMEQTISNKKYGEDYLFKSILFNVEQAESPYPSESFDVVIFCEILEHLVTDQPDIVLKKINKMLKPGGLIILTTPNATRLVNIACMLENKNIFDLIHPENGVFGRHNREYTVDEIKYLFSTSNYELMTIETLDRFDYDQIPIGVVEYCGISYTNQKKNDVLSLLSRHHLPMDNRGDNIYAVAKKIKT